MIDEKLQDNYYTFAAVLRLFLVKLRIQISDLCEVMSFRTDSLSSEYVTFNENKVALLFSNRCQPLIVYCLEK